MAKSTPTPKPQNTGAAAPKPAAKTKPDTPAKPILFRDFASI